MRETILSNLNDPKQLESIYRNDKSNFRRYFNELYEEIKGSSVTADVWYERLNYSVDSKSLVSFKDLFFVILASLFATLIAKIPDIFSIDDDFFYPRNIGFIVFPVLMVWFARKNNLDVKLFSVLAILVSGSAIFINLLPSNPDSQTLILSCVHLPLFLFSLTGIVFMGNNWKYAESRFDFLRYIGDLIVMSAIIVLAGGLMSLITIQLFRMIDMNIENFYQEYVIVWGASTVPVAATYIIQSNKQIVSKVSPVIARIFSPLVLIVVIVYLSSMLITGKDPYNDRDFLLAFNLLLVGVLALIMFSVAEAVKSGITKSEIIILFLLALSTVVVNFIALSAIVFRISEWGFTPNKIAVLTGNLLILINLLAVTFRLAFSIKDENKLELVKKVIAAYLPVYSVWAFIVTFVFPVIFRFK